MRLHPVIVEALIALALLLTICGLQTLEAQVLPTEYRLTRTLPLPAQTFTFPRSAMTCNLVKGPVASAPGLRIDDPTDPARDCELLGDAGGVIQPRVPGIAYAYQIVACLALPTGAECSPPGLYPDVSAPTTPGGRRLRPVPAPGVDVAGVVGVRYPYPLPNGVVVDVATSTLDDNATIVHVGALSLTVPGYSVRPGDRVAISFWRP